MGFITLLEYVVWAKLKLYANFYVIFNAKRNYKPDETKQGKTKIGET